MYPVAKVDENIDRKHPLTLFNFFFSTKKNIYIRSP